MNDLNHIPVKMHQDVIAVYWQMLRECENKAHDGNDPILKHMVECWYHQWNEFAQDNKKPVWVEKYL